jgi:mannose-6-phosphate isomerase
LGRNIAKSKKQFPLLVKFLDAHDRLSLQVHPNDAQAARFDPTENGKNEAWVIVEADPGSRLFAGLKSGVDADELRRRLGDNTLEECLHAFEVSAGDCVFIPAGTVHAIGEGILLAEVQQSSDLTFRLYDWGRVGTDGKPRELHIAEALECTDFARGPVDPVTPELLPDGGERLVESPYFRLTRYRGPRKTTLASEENCHVLIGLAGTTTFEVGEHRETLETGQTVLVPAECPETHMDLAAGAVVIEAMPM